MAAVVCTAFFVVMLRAFVVVVVVAVGFAVVVDNCVVVWVVVVDSTSAELEQVVVRCVVLVVCSVVVFVSVESVCVFSFSAMPLQAVSSSAVIAITNAFCIVSPPTRRIPQPPGNIQAIQERSTQVTV